MNIKPATPMWKWVLGANIWFCVLLISPHQAEARDIRLALLVGNQTGWKNDAKLNYVIRGDLRPMGKTLRAIGFKVRILENRSPQVIRQVFKRLYERTQQSPKVTTFLFYYTGHADRHYFHMGNETNRPFAYAEFRKLFYRLPITRRVAIIDACHSGEIVKQFGSEKQFKILLKRGTTKGVRASRRTANLLRLLRPSQGHEKGLRVIGSSRFLSWEIRKYKASVFTHHLLRGLGGKADLNQDGRISLDELFDYTRQQVYRDTGQRPQQYKQVIIGEPYAFAPAYRSQLRIAANVVGQLKIAVANFIWFKHKRSRKTVSLSIVDGKGMAYLRKKKDCFRQTLNLPKGGFGTLQAHLWKRIPCKRMAMTPKGSIFLATRAPVLHKKERMLDIAFQTGYVYLGEPIMRAHNINFGFDIRYNFFGAGFSFTTGRPVEKRFQISRMFLRADLGYPAFFNHWSLFFGLYAHGGLTIQYRQKYPILTTLSIGAGSGFDISWWWTQELGLRLGGRIGFDYTPISAMLGISLHAQLHISVLFAFLQTTTAGD